MMQSKKENIWSYIFHIWAMEDYLRAFPEHADAKDELRELNEMMHREGVMKSGHVQLAQIALQEMEELHAQLLDEDALYRARIIRLQPSLAILKSKTDRPTMSDIEACFTLIYQTFLLRMQHREISTETAAVEKQAKVLLESLSRIYHDNQTAV